MIYCSKCYKLNKGKNKIIYKLKKSDVNNIIEILKCGIV